MWSKMILWVRLDYFSGSGAPGSLRDPPGCPSGPPSGLPSGPPNFQVFEACSRQPQKPIKFNTFGLLFRLRRPRPLRGGSSGRPSSLPSGPSSGTPSGPPGRTLQFLGFRPPPERITFLIRNKYVWATFPALATPASPGGPPGVPPATPLGVPLPGLVPSVGGSAMHMKWPDGIGRDAGLGPTRSWKELSNFRACPC